MEVKISTDWITLFFFLRHITEIYPDCRHVYLFIFFRCRLFSFLQQLRSCPHKKRVIQKVSLSVCMQRAQGYKVLVKALCRSHTWVTPASPWQPSPMIEEQQELLHLTVILRQSSRPKPLDLQLKQMSPLSKKSIKENEIKF